MTMPMPPQAPLEPPTPPWTPFAEEPVDAEPWIANIRKRRLGLLMASTEFQKFSPAWQQQVRDAYTRAVQHIQAAQQAQAAATAGRPSPPKPGESPAAPEGLVAG